MHSLLKGADIQPNENYQHVSGNEPFHGFISVSADFANNGDVKFARSIVIGNGWTDMSHRFIGLEPSWNWSGLSPSDWQNRIYGFEFASKDRWELVRFNMLLAP